MPLDSQVEHSCHDGAGLEVETWSYGLNMGHMILKVDAKLALADCILAYSRQIHCLALLDRQGFGCEVEPGDEKYLLYEEEPRS